MGDDLNATVDGHRLSLVIEPAARLNLLLSTIGNAKHSLSLVYYIFANDSAGRIILSALIKAARSGVDVRLIIDGFGSQDSPESAFAPLIDAGGKVMRFNPRYGRRYLLRNHQKILLADGRLALIGGCNISNDYFSAPAQRTTWHDLILCIEGPAARRLKGYYDSLFKWTQNSDAKVWELRAVLTDFSEASGSLRWLHGGLFRRLSPLTRSIRSDIDQASSVHMIEAFFAPNWAMLRRLGHVVRRGGSCHITTAAFSSNTTTVAAARHTYHRLLRFGVSISEYVTQRLHMKLILADDAVYIGSANFDARSLYINVEIMLRIEDTAFAAQMRQWLSAQASDDEIITYQTHTARSTVLNRLRWLTAYFIVSTLDYSVSRRLNISDKA